MFGTNILPPGIWFPFLLWVAGLKLAWYLCRLVMKFRLWAPEKAGGGSGGVKGSGVSGGNPRDGGRIGPIRAGSVRVHDNRSLV